jgi:hypothetical protein
MLKFISVGKYNSGLFHRGRLVQSSVFGGLATIVFAAVFISYVAVVFT